MYLFIIAIFLSAFLLFQVQPIVARYILPWYGGSPAVWTTCMLFFQIGLLAGYGYAHFLASYFRKNPKAQLFIHLGVLATSLIFMPITPDQDLRPVGGNTSEVWGILKLLAMTVGLPYIAISASGPLLQHWFAGACPGKSPYRLYAVSNFGSLLGLLSYPFLFEPMLGLKHQTWWWSGGFVIYGIIAITCAWAYNKSQAERPLDREIDQSNLREEDKPSLGRKILWVAFATCGSAGMLAITNQMCQDVTVVPFLWVLPLSLYLTTFIISFDRETWYQRFLWVPLAVLGVGALIILINQQTLEGSEDKTLFWQTIGWIRDFCGGDLVSTEVHFYWQIGFYMFALFTLCMVCHGEMVRLKPASRHLTSFYLLISLGGAMGGAFVSIIAPQIFNGYWELHLLLFVTTLLVGLVISIQAFKRYRSFTWGTFGIVSTALLLVMYAFGLRNHFKKTNEDAIASLRSFHGVVHVKEGYKDDPESHYLALYHGRITHGKQFQSPEFRNIPTTYYGENSGVGAVLQTIPQRVGDTRKPIKMGVIGLGSGSLAVHAKEGDDIVFYEINPKVEQLARSHFTYLKDCAGNESVVLGDARTSLENELAQGQPRDFDILFIDAFSGDSIPFHLVTKEVFDIYFKHLKEDGSLVVHITNLHIDLSDPVRQLAKKFDREAMLVMDDPDLDSHYYSSEWVIITKNKDLMDRLKQGQWINEWTREQPKPIHWTDDYSNLIQVIMHD